MGENITDNKTKDGAETQGTAQRPDVHLQCCQSVLFNSVNLGQSALFNVLVKSKVRFLAKLPLLGSSDSVSSRGIFLTAHSLRLVI